MKFIKGITFAPFIRHGELMKRETLDSFDSMVERTCADFVIIVPGGLQDTPQSERIDFTSDAAVSDEELEAFIDYAHSKGMPHILAEVKHELEWLLKMQRNDGGVYHKATTAFHAPFVMPEEDTAQMYVFDVSSMAAADVAAVAALACGMYRGMTAIFQTGFSRLRNAPLNGWTAIRNLSDSAIPRATIQAVTVSGTTVPTGTGLMRKCMR